MLHQKSCIQYLGVRKTPSVLAASEVAVIMSLTEESKNQNTDISVLRWRGRILQSPQCEPHQLGMSNKA